MAASPYSHSSSLRLARLVRWAVPKSFKLSQSSLLYSCWLGHSVSLPTLRQPSIIALPQARRCRQTPNATVASESWAPSVHLEREASPPQQAASPTKAKEQIYRALNNFYSQSIGVLSLKKDDFVIIVKKDSNGKQGHLSISYCFVQTINSGASEGWAPSAYLKKEKT